MKFALNKIQTFLKKDLNPISQCIRVNHAGELGAKYIYLGQLKVIDDKKIAEMLNHELEHLEYFTRALKERGIRSSYINPLWKVIGFLGGALSAFIGRNYAMSCTYEVEKVIEQHYQEQIKMLEEHYPEEKELIAKIKKFLADEQEHMHTAEDLGSARAVKPFKSIVYTMTKLAIKISKRI